MTWKERKILVTGGSRGIGRAITSALLDRGVSRVAVAAEETSPPDWDSFADRGAVYFSSDLSRESTPGALVREAAERLGGIDGLVHCAGVYPEANPGDRTTLDLWEETMNVKARAGYLLAHEFARVAEEGGSFVGVTSINAEQSEPRHLAYDPACAALAGVIRACAIEHAPRLRFNAVAPGLIHTRLTEGLQDSPGERKHAEDNIPMRRIGQPEDCAGAVLFLLGEESAYVTGETIFVDGGIRANQMSRPS